VGDALQLVVQNSSTLVAGLVIAFVSNWELSLIILALIPLIGLNGWIQMKFIQGFSADAKVCYLIPNCLCLRFIVDCIKLHLVICECR
jgi:ATP-binding cassette subfamily B (MDR/TAP) protein 1